MATAKQLAAEAAKVLWKGAALITAADWEDGEVKRVPFMEAVERISQLQKGPEKR